MDDQKRIFGLLEKFEQGLATNADVKELEAWYQTFEDRPDILAELSETEKFRARENMLERITSIIPERLQKNSLPLKKVVTLWQRWMVAATLLIMLSAGSYFFLQKDHSETQYSNVLKEDFKPGYNKAILTLAGGKQIILTGAKNGQLANQGGSIIRKTAEGEVVYGSGKGNKVVMNTMSTPRGGQYRLTLVDGTKVWLNAASSITYPSGFIGNNRQVEITGEVYFEVAHNALKPFLVKSGLQTVEVLGTHFNINAYNDEGRIKTTLLEGAVSIAAGGGRQRLKPGEQAVVKNNAINISEVDTDEAIAWKDGYFQFVDADIQTVMRQISRWYDVEVVFDGSVTRQTFTGRISRERNISNVLKIVQSYKDVQLVFKGRRIMVK